MGGIEAMAFGNAVLSGGVAMGSGLTVSLTLLALLATTVAGIATLIPRRRRPRSLRVTPALPAHSR